MGIKVYKPTSNGRRNMTVNEHSAVTKSTPEKSLLAPLKSKGGRNNRGCITVRHRGGGVKRHYRIIDFKRNFDNVPAKVAAIEYDPNRTCHIALLNYVDGRKAYILAPKGLNVGDIVLSGDNADIKIGHAKKLNQIPVGTTVHNVELNPGQGGKMIRAAGAAAQILGREGKYVLLKLKSGEMRLVLGECKATVGTVGNEEHGLVKIGKAGKSRYMGRRPHVRGSVMNPNDHPHGGGEAKAPIGRPSPLSPWGKKTLGKKTRKHNKQSNKYIYKDRRNK